MASAMQNNTERWLVHEGLRFKYAGSDSDAFRFTISGPEDVRDINTEIFEPAGQPGIIVIGRKCPFGTRQNVRYQNMTESERQKVRERISAYCNSIGAVHRFSAEAGRETVGVYIVLDSEDRLNQMAFSDSLKQITEMSDGVKEYLMRTV